MEKLYSKISERKNMGSSSKTKHLWKHPYNFYHVKLVFDDSLEPRLYVKVSFQSIFLTLSEAGKINSAY